MPREQINYPDLLQKQMQVERLAADPPADKSDYGPWNDASTHVQWQGVDKDEADGTRRGIGWVQVGLEVDVEYAKFALENCNGARPDRSVMWTPVLSPAEVDRMIAALKRAKRKAFKLA